MKSSAKACLVLLAALSLSALSTNAQTNATPTSTNTPAVAKPRPKPYTGTIASVDSSAKTITITLASGASQTLHIGAKTRLKKDGQAATLADATVGEKIRGSAHKDESGDWVANTVTIGEPKPKASAAPGSQQ
jgi:Cu/Ag efflux protein CusF